MENHFKKRVKRKIFWQSVTQMNGRMNERGATESGAALLYAIRMHYNTCGWRTSAR